MMFLGTVLDGAVKGRVGTKTNFDFVHRPRTLKLYGTENHLSYLGFLESLHSRRFSFRLSQFKERTTILCSSLYICFLKIYGYPQKTGGNEIC